MKLKTEKQKNFNINISNYYIIKSVPRACKQILASQATNGEAVKFNI